MIAYEQLYHLDVAGIKGAVDQWTEFIRRYDTMEQAFRDEVVTNFDAAGWNSVDGTHVFARVQIASANKEFIDAVTEAKGLRAVLDDAHDELKACKKELLDLEDKARGEGVLISGTGKVTLKDPKPEGDKPIEIAPGMPAPDGATPNRIKIAAWEARIEVILVKATDIDISAATALRRNTGEGGKEGFNDKTVKSVDQDEAQRSAKLLEKYEKGEKLTPAQLKELERVMSHNEKDPEFSRMLLNDLGPEATLRLQQDLESERAGDGANKDKYNSIQNSLANSVGAANQDKKFSEQWLKDMEKLGTKRADGDYDGDYGYQTLTGLLKHGDAADYPPHMTMGLTDDMIAAEKKNPEIWSDVRRVTVGNEDVGPQTLKDPVDDMLGIMSDDPDTATKYLDPAGDKGEERMKYLFDKRDWPDTEIQKETVRQDDVGEPIHIEAKNNRVGFADAIEAATTGEQPGSHRADFDKGHGDDQARVMQRTISLLDNNGDGGGDKIPANMREPLARSLGDYTADTHKIIAGSEDGYRDPDGYRDKDGNRRLLGEGDDSHITSPERSVIRVMRGISEDGEAFQHLYKSERDYSAEQMGSAPKAGGEGNENHVVPAVDTGNVLGAYNAIGSDAYLDAKDERKQWADDMGKGLYHGPGLALGQVPVIGDPALRMLDMAVYDWTKDVKLEAEATADSENAKEKASGLGGTNDLINAWYQEREKQGEPIGNMTQRAIAQQSEQGYVTSRNSALEDLGRTV
ncbi:hypothetical protein [Streptomyces boluensis]|uniref:AG2 protein n=1 Tax=Streptomyces boluensis TaxID=1775135 RepID=A0A964UQR7_9ACTN|nr:hypothetical protein [Streptomyces boluensis]NBE53614.1 hypothetical protein [Streptomyces boluensis]